MLRAARTQHRDREHARRLPTVAHACIVVLVACGGEERTPSDARRNCADTATPHDEDGDGVVDACDNCPAIANPTQSDTSEIAARAFADGVGDACDPRPGVGGDVLRAFYSFESEAQADAWTGSGFSISGDALHANGDARWTSTRRAMGDGVFVLAQIASLTFGAAGELAITIDGDGIGAGVTCTLSAQQLVAREAGAGSTAVDLATAIEPDEPVMLVAWRAIGLAPTGRAAKLTCRVTRGNVATEATLALSDDLLDGVQVIAAHDASVAIASVSVYTSPGAKNP